jgi:hypothetical protein
MFNLFVNMMHLVVIEQHSADGCVCGQRAALSCALSICRSAVSIHTYLVAQRCVLELPLLLSLWLHWLLSAVGDFAHMFC